MRLTDPPASPGEADEESPRPTPSLRGDINLIISERAMDEIERRDGLLDR